ncbi:alpha/beta fold hydrolase [Streptomyces sp. NPDC049936]|uniref:alpha/beta fold hydrolase n=1 Tax=Streptomyces sp. NPDC049936 TaxID=3365599 RepID=UPI0037A9902F
MVLLHGWPGDASDYRRVVPQLAGEYRVIVPDLRGFGASDRHPADPDRFYSASAQAASIQALITELGLVQPVVAGYDIGSRTAQTLARRNPESVGALVLSPPLPGAGRRVLDPEVVPELWYQSFHRSAFGASLIDGDRDRVRTYLRHFWEHWSGPGFVPGEADFEALVDRYARPGAFEASIAWYRVGDGYLRNALAERPPERQGRIGVPVHVLWQELDPLFPRGWADRLDDFFRDAILHTVDGVGHFTPLEAPEAFAELVRQAARAVRPDAGKARPSAVPPM